MTTLEERRHQADMTMMLHKAMTGKDAEDRAAWFRPPTVAAARTRKKNSKNNGRLEMVRNFYTVKTCRVGNEIPGRFKKTTNGSELQECVCKLP
jgi:hypothetical protein